MKKCAIVIGINNTERMPPLAGAASGAKDFAQWARSQQFHVELHTDEVGPVTFDDVYSSVEKIVQSRKCKTLVIFFSGHGRWISAGTETWLLSKPTKPGQGIEVYPSSLLATGCGIANVIFISDACRSVITDPVILNASAHPIFTFKQSSIDTKIDMMFACLPSEAAYETQSGTDGSKAFGIYTSLVLNGLSGKVPEVQTPLTAGKGIRKLVVEGNKLHEYLWKTLPQEVAKLDPKLTQRPHSAISSRLPKHFLAEFQDGTYVPDTKPKDYIDVNEVVHYHVREPLIWQNPILLNEDLHEKEALEALLGTDPGFDPQEYIAFRHHTHPLATNPHSRDTANLLVYESSDLLSMSNYSLHVARPRQPSMGEPPQRSEHLHTIIQHLPDRHTSIGKTENRNDNLLLLLNNNNMALLPILKDFKSRIWMKEGKVMHISLQPTSQNPKYSEYVEHFDPIEGRVSLMISVAHTGANRPLLGTRGFELIADYLRRGKSFDPVLGVYAAYMYAQAGLKNDIVSVYRYMLREPEPVLFDVQMLAMLVGARESRTQDDELLRTGYPILSQGWQHLPEQVLLFRPDLKDLSHRLIPGLWTTFTPDAREILY